MAKGPLSSLRDTVKRSGRSRTEYGKPGASLTQSTGYSSKKESMANQKNNRKNEKKKNEKMKENGENRKSKMEK
jgi:hypothetical protein